MSTNPDYDVIVIGSGAGGGPVAYELANAGRDVLVLEKGAWFKEKDFAKDEIRSCRRSVFTPNLRDERHVIEELKNGEWDAESTLDSGWDFWNGSMVGGSSNLMSGFFHRLKPDDFNLLSKYGKINYGNIVDWPITYDDLEPYYEKVERIVGVSGKYKKHKFSEPRSTSDYPYPPTTEHHISSLIDDACQKLEISNFPVPRAILTKPEGDRGACYLSGYCGSYGCNSKAKGSSRVALLDKAVETGKCQIRPNSYVFNIKTNSKGKIEYVEYLDKSTNIKRKVSAKIYVIAAQSVETSRLLLNSKSVSHPNGLSNKNGQVGKNLIFSSGGSANCELPFEMYPQDIQEKMKIQGPFINRAVQEYYEYEDSQNSNNMKGGTIEFLMRHPNPIARSNYLKWDDDGLMWGKKLQEKMYNHFTKNKHLRFEVFVDWTPNDHCFVSLGGNEKDKWGLPVAKVRIGQHGHDKSVGKFMNQKGVEIFEALGGKNIQSHLGVNPPSNLQAGGCRFGDDPENSVLDKDCRSHEIENLFVTDGSFMPTGGSVPFTWTIYANSFRVADLIKNQL